MRLNDALIDRIYEAAIDDAQWPVLLQDVSECAGAQLAAFLVRSPDGLSWTGSTLGQRVIDDFMDEGWASDPFVTPLLQELHPGYRTETNYRSVEDIERSRIHREFWKPRGLIAGAGTVIQGANDDLIHLTWEGFATHAAATAAVPLLDRLRPHMARALSLTVHLRAARAAMIVDSLAIAGVGAAIVSSTRRLKAANSVFEARLGSAIDTGMGRFRFIDPVLQARFERGMTEIGVAPAVRSIAPRFDFETTPFALHLLPLRGRAMDRCDSDGVLILLADAANAALPGADLLRLLFDLTPAEARLVRRLAEGVTVTDAAQGLGISIATARVHLRSAFAKIGVSRQADLIALMGRLAPPTVSAAM